MTISQISSSFQNSSSPIFNTMSTESTHETSLNMLTTQLNESLVNNKILNSIKFDKSHKCSKINNEKCSKINNVIDKQFCLLNHIDNHYDIDNNSNNKNNDIEINKGKSSRKNNKIWCPALELEEIS
ncbi:hypothetical protein EWB00_006572 [Schistosoma japonicum]|uniref:Uncharacterized protein n=1 Tax=Schistosoma japonicum TaxID=6182 RepID=A0A4Z2DSZ1_SCHJA|nr:hypothetical protein EWB00_006572 [Schistosoma japonicum]